MQLLAAQDFTCNWRVISRLPVNSPYPQGNEDFWGQGEGVTNLRNVDGIPFAASAVAG